MKKIRLITVLFFLSFLITACGLTGKDKNVGIVEGKVLEINLKNVIINIQENSDISTLDFEYDHEMYKVDTKTKGNITTVDISAVNSSKEMQLQIPPNMFQQISVKGNNSVLGIDKINVDYVILMDRGILNMSLPENYDKCFNLTATGAISQIELNQANINTNIKNNMGYIQVPDDWEDYSDQKEYQHNASDTSGSMNMKIKRGDVSIKKSNNFDGKSNSGKDTTNREESSEDKTNREESGEDTKLAEKKVIINIEYCNVYIKSSDKISAIEYKLTDPEVQVEKEDKNGSKYITIGKTKENTDIVAPRQKDSLSRKKCDATILIPCDIYDMLELEAVGAGVAVSDMAFGMDMLLYDCAIDIDVPFDYKKDVSCKADNSSCNIWFDESMEDFNLTVDSDMSITLPSKWPNYSPGLTYYEYVGKEGMGNYNFIITNSSFAIRLYK